MKADDFLSRLFQKDEEAELNLYSVTEHTIDCMVALRGLKGSYLKDRNEMMMKKIFQKNSRKKSRLEVEFFFLIK